MRRFLQSAFLYATNSDHVPQLLRRGAMLGMLGMILISFAAANVQALLWQSSQWLVSTVLPTIVVELTNEERAATALPALRRSNVLDQAAQMKAEHMAKEEYFAHYSPEGVTPWDWFDKAGYVYAHAGENLAIHFSDSSEVVEAWMKSPTHRANIVNDNYTEIGIGTAKGTYQGHETVFVVQLFGAPALVAERPAPQVDAPLMAPAPAVPVATLAPTSSAETASGVELGATGSVIGASSSVLVTQTASATAMALSYESTPRTPESIPLPPEPVLSVEEYEVQEDMVSLYSGIVATSSGLPVLLEAAPQESAGATKTAFFSRIATQPNMILTLVYGVLSAAIGLMLLLAIALAVRSQKPWQVVYSLALLVLMGGLITLHLYVTAGALVV